MPTWRAPNSHRDARRAHFRAVKWIRGDCCLEVVRLRAADSGHALRERRPSTIICVVPGVIRPVQRGGGESQTWDLRNSAILFGFESLR
jgi:hypothetical protein